MITYTSLFLSSQANGNEAIVGGGIDNTVSANYGGIGGGQANSVQGL